jgi:hypothetical protein
MYCTYVGGGTKVMVVLGSAVQQQLDIVTPRNPCTMERFHPPEETHIQPTSYLLSK